MGGPRGYLDTFVFLLNEARGTSAQLRQAQGGFNQIREYAFELIKNHELQEEWDTFISEKENAVQEQQTEEIPVQEEAESGEEVVETPKEDKKE